MRRRGVVILSVAAAAVVLLTAAVAADIPSYLQDGMTYIQNHNKVYASTGSTVPGSWTVSVDLANPSSNVGRVLYRDGKYSIMVASVELTQPYSNGGWRITFRSRGTSSWFGATLVSGQEFVQLPDDNSNMGTSKILAKMTATLGNQTYESMTCGSTSLTYDGDEFSFFIFPYEATQSGKITQNEKGTVRLTVTELCKNVWKRK